MSRRALKLICLVAGTVAVSSVAGFFLGNSGRLGLRPRAHLLRVRISTIANGEAINYVMLADLAECSKLLKKASQDWDEIRRKARVSVDFECVPEDNLSVPVAWRNPTRRIGKWQGCDVYYYHEPEPQNLAGAFVLALPNENDKPAHFAGEPEVDEIFVDQKTCDTRLAAYNDTYKSGLEYQRDAEHDPKLKAAFQDLKKTVQSEARNASGACLPIANAMPLVNRLCEGLPLILTVQGGEGTYSCDRNIVKPDGTGPN
jgi:hypothetical protein